MSSLTAPTMPLVGWGLTFDDVLLLPGDSDVLPADVDVSARLSANLVLPLPILSSPMDTVTEARLAIALARIGGMGILHRSMTPDQQAEMIGEVKRADFCCEETAALDRDGRLLVGAAVGVGESLMNRIGLLHESGADVIVLDSAHGHSRRIVESAAMIKREWPGVYLIAGNVATADAAVALITAGADALRVGVGPGSICTTRIVAGVGVPQLTAVWECVQAARAMALRTQRPPVPVIADGGIRYSGDIVKAIAAGASAVMLGSLLAATDEAPGETYEDSDGKSYRQYRGMGALGALMSGPRDRYGASVNTAPAKLVPEGIEGRVRSKGPLAQVIHQLAGGLRAGMGYIGAGTLEEMPLRARFIQVTHAGLAESHPHDIQLMQEAPNYDGRR